MVTLLDETRHGLEDGDFVTFTEIKGMEGLNNAEPRKIVVKGRTIPPFLSVVTDSTGPYTFTIGDTRGLGTYKSGGLFTQVKMPKILQFVSTRSRRRRQSLTEPEIPQREPQRA